VYVSDIHIEREAQTTLLAAKVEARDPRISDRVEYRFHDLPPDMVSTAGDPFVAGLLIPAMAVGEDLIVEAPVSPTLLNKVDSIQSWLRAWRPGLHPARVEAAVAEPVPAGDGVGLFFSGGIDSYHSLLRNMQEHPAGKDAITHLIFGYGIDTRYGYDRRYMDRVSPFIQSIAEATGKRVVILESNLRQAFSATGWMLYHGSALISGALCLAPLFNRVLVAGSWATTYLIPWGSHPELDPLWSTDAVEIVHDSVDCTRLEKVVTQVGRSELALRTLRVCFEVEQQPRNCGRCPKCIETMLILHIAGVLESCSTFDAGLDPKRVHALPINHKRRVFENYLELLGDSSFDQRLARALRGALRRDRLRIILRRVLRRKG
jgi:hypothetical protein